MERLRTMRRVFAVLVSCLLVMGLVPMPGQGNVALATEPEQDEAATLGNEDSNVQTSAPACPTGEEGKEGAESPLDDGVSEVGENSDESQTADAQEEPLAGSENTNMPVEEGAAEETPEIAGAAENGEEAADAPESDESGAALGVQSNTTTITYMPVEPITFVLGEGQWYDWEQAYCYRYVPEVGDQLKVTKGSTTTTYTCNGFSWYDSNGWFAQIEVQLYAYLAEAQNKVGTKQMTVDYFIDYSKEASGTVDFQIVKSPLTSIAYEPAQPIVLVRGADSSNYYEYDYGTKTGHTYHHYFFPRGTRLMGDRLIVTREDGATERYIYKSFKNPKYGYEDLGYVNVADSSDIIYLDDLTITADQPYAKRWGVGNHSFTLQYKGQTTTIPVRVKNPEVTKVAYTCAKAIRRSASAAITYTQNMGLYDASYAKKVTKYEIVFKEPTPAAGDILTLTEKGGSVVRYAYNASRQAFVNKEDSQDVIPQRDVTIGSTKVKVTTTSTAFPCSYQGIDFTIPFTIAKAKQTVKAKNKEVRVGKKVKLAASSTGFAETGFTYKSSNTKVATVNAQGVVSGKKVGTVKITIRAKANAAFKKSAVKKVTVHVGKSNPMRVTSKKRVTIKRGKSALPIKVTKAKGRVRYANVSTQAVAKTFKVNAKTGRITVPKKTKKGTYVLKVRVRAKGTKAYLSKTVTKTIKVKVS